MATATEEDLWEEKCEQIRQTMKERGDTYTDLARAIGCNSYSQIYGWINGDKHPRAGLLLSLEKNYLSKKKGEY